MNKKSNQMNKYKQKQPLPQAQPLPPPPPPQQQKNLNETKLIARETNPILDPRAYASDF